MILTGANCIKTVLPRSRHLNTSILRHRAVIGCRIADRWHDGCVRCLSACAVHRPNGTRARNAPSRIAPAPLRNRQIAFGGGRFPVRCISHRCVPLRGRWAARLARARGGFRRASTPPPRIRLHPRRAIHPPLRRAWLGREASLRQSHPSRRRLAPRGVGFALAPWQARLTLLRAIGTCPFLRRACRAP